MMGYRVYATRNPKREKELQEVKERYGVTGFEFYRRPYLLSVEHQHIETRWTCTRQSKDFSIEVKQTDPKVLNDLLDRLLNLNDDPNPPTIMFGPNEYNSLEELWKAMGKI